MLKYLFKKPIIIQRYGKQIIFVIERHTDDCQCNCEVRKMFLPTFGLNVEYNDFDAHLFHQETFKKLNIKNKLRVLRAGGL